MIKKVALIETHTDIPNIYSSFVSPRVGIPIIGSILKSKGYDIDIYNDKIKKPGIKQLLQYDLIGISSLTNTSPAGYKYADGLKKHNKTVVLGGPHATFLPEEGLCHADYVVRREGEETLIELIEAINNNKPLEGIKGLSFRRNGNIIHNEDREFKDEYLKISPDFSLIKGAEDAKKGLISKYTYFTNVYTSRGCPYNCRYCTVIKIAGRQMRYRDLDDCIEDIKLAARDISIYKTIGISDDNLTINMPRAKEFLRKIINEKFPEHIGFTVQLKIDSFKDDEFLSLLRDARFRIVHLGYESINQNTLNNWNKSQSIEDIKFTVEQGKKFNIKINGMFVVGSDVDTKETIEKTVDFAIDSGLTTMQMWILTPLPGSDVYRQINEEHRIFNTNWKFFDCQHSVFFPSLMKPSTLQSALAEANKKFYTFKRMFYNAIGSRITYGTNAHMMDRAIRDYAKRLKNFEDKFYTKDGELITEKLAENNPEEFAGYLY
ncbi:MAG: radical SAM protein [Candidatus Eremiobacterota bacterium]